jgi:Asp-tRNA(Asn)/Glu-tRNA(Gln) amidotransferase A subunit family amidase
MENSNFVKLPRTMKRPIVSFLMLGILCLSGAQAIPAAEPTETIETRLREKLRDTMLQLRDAQTAVETERAALEAAQAQSADEKKALTEKLEAITKEANANSLAAKAVDGLKIQVARQDKEIAQLKGTMESCQQAVELTRKQDAERAKLVDEAVTELERLVADRQTKNLALYKIGTEILQRYKRFGLGDAITAREPFVGLTRVKLQNLVQDYQDKLLNERTTLEKKDLESYQDKLRKQPAPTSKSDSSAAKQTSE